MIWPTTRPLLMAGSVIAIISCGGTNPNAPGSVSCRTYATATSLSSIPINSVGYRNPTSSFDQRTHQLTTIESQQNSSGPCVITVRTYKSNADFIDEVQVTARTLVDNVATSTSASCGGNTFPTLFYTYDSRRRLKSIAPFGAVSITYYAWDNSGRPTAGTLPGGDSETFVYDDAARTSTHTQVISGHATTWVTTYDANGIVIQNVDPSGTTIYTTTATAQVCK